MSVRIRVKEIAEAAHMVVAEDALMRAMCRAAALAAEDVATWDEVDKTTLDIVRGFLIDMKAEHNASR